VGCIGAGYRSERKTERVRGSRKEMEEGATGVRCRLCFAFFDSVSYTTHIATSWTDIA